MNSNENTGLIGDQTTVTSQQFDILKKISKIRVIYLRAFKLSMSQQLDIDLPLLFKEGNNEQLFKDIKSAIILRLVKYMDERYMSVLDQPDVQEKLNEYYRIDSSYQNRSAKFALLAAEEETSLKQEALDKIRQKRSSMHELVGQTNRIKEEKYEQLNAIFDDIVLNICKYDSVGAYQFDKEKLFD